jgi:hypothetical protein
MFKTIAALALVPFAPAQAETQVTPEQAHVDATGPSTMCGVTADDANGLMRLVRQRHRFRRQPIESSRFEVFQTRDSTRQWVFTKPSEPAYPAISCREFYTDMSGGTSQRRSLRCDASRQACDRLFQEFSDLDNRMIRTLRGN